MDSIRDQIWAEALHRYNAGEQYKEMHQFLQPIRDAAAGAKAGSEHLEGFTEFVSEMLERDAANLAAGSPVARDPLKGYSMDELVTAFLAKNEIFGGGTVPTDKVVNFRRQNSAQLTACLKELGMVNRKITRKKVMRWFRGE